MVALYVGGQKVEWADAERVLAHRAPNAGRVELRTDAGAVLGVVVPQTPANEGEADWVRAITPEEITRRMAGPLLTLEEYRKQAGSQ